MKDSEISRRDNWKKKIEAWQASGKTITVWCQENKISYVSFLSWRKRLGYSFKGQQQKTPFVELPEDRQATETIELLFKGITLRLSNQFDPSALLRCLDVLKRL